MSEELRWKDGEPCDHPGCLSHITHPCEGCGRVGGRPIEEAMSEELKPCPFCPDGGEAKAMSLIHGPTVQCMACGATQGIFGSAEEAAEAWNRRAADERVRELEDALDDLLDGLDANADERCGLTQEQWDKRIEKARAIPRKHGVDNPPSAGLTKG